MSWLYIKVRSIKYSQIMAVHAKKDRREAKKIDRTQSTCFQHLLITLNPEHMINITLLLIAACYT